MLHALSSALGSTCKCTSTDDQSIIQQSSDNIPLEEAIEIVGEEMNGKIHQLAGRFLSQERFDYRTIQFDKLIESHTNTFSSAIFIIAFNTGQPLQHNII